MIIKIMKMKNSLALTFILCFFLTQNIYSQKKVESGVRQITPELLKQYIDYLASDSMKGRNTPSPELNRAADYIAKEFAALGIKKVNGSYFQNIPFCTKNLDVKNCLLKITNGDNIKEFNLKTDYTPFEATSSTSATGLIVFAGYGITALEYNYDDYKDIDVKGKIVLILKHEPGEKDAKSPFKGEKETKYSFLNSKMENAKNHGALAVLVVNDPLNHMMLTPQGYPWPSLSKFLPQDNLPIELCKEGASIPFAQVGESVIKFIFGSVDSLKNVQRRIDQSYTPKSYSISNSTCEIATKLVIQDIVARNVVGVIEGKSTSLKDEIIIIGGHYDHVGFMVKHKPDEDYIFNGADDNASGTAGVMATAKAFASMESKPKRSILFILFAGEEKGLYGSSYYCSTPLFPLNKTVAMLNMDMISRNGNDSIQIEGDTMNQDLAKIIKAENAKVGLLITPSAEDLYGRSDQYSFFKKEISSIGFTSGLHKDYHTLRDDPQSINPFKASQISRLVFRTAWIIASEKKHYSIIKKH